MTDLLQHASDDQLALAICFGGLLFSGLVMYFSFHVGQFAARVKIHDSGPLSEFERRHAHSSEAVAHTEVAAQDKAA